MTAWTNPSDPAQTSTERTSTDSGLLRPERLSDWSRLERHPCSPALARWVENYWTLRWNLPEGETRPSQVVPHPACTLSVETGDTRPEVGADPVVVTGVPTRRFDVEIRGRGEVVAAKFRPGGFAALTGVDAAELTDRVRPLGDVLPDGRGRAVARMLAAGQERPIPERLADLESGLTRLAEGVAPDERYELVLRIVAASLGDRSLIRVGQLCDRFKLSERSLQRLFERYVGVPAKWLLRRYRLHDAISALDDGYDGSLAELAATLGWYDQSHFNREFVAATGVAPGDYRTRAR